MTHVKYAGHSDETARSGTAATGLRVMGPLLGQGNVCEQILRALPQWFGMEVGVLNYIRSAGELPSFVAYLADEPVGIALVKRHFELGAEVYLMGVLPTRHRMGIGRALLRQEGVSFLQAKTLSSRSADVGYAKTRAFYLAMGFAPVEEFPTLWNEQNPCLLLIKRVPESS
jgi:GNAT superfamily N-acetyltransferase